MYVSGTVMLLCLHETSMCDVDARYYVMFVRVSLRTIAMIHFRNILKHFYEILLCEAMLPCRSRVLEIFSTCERSRFQFLDIRQILQTEVDVGFLSLF
jgi:hypothetical protein